MTSNLWSGTTSPGTGWIYVLSLVTDTERASILNNDTSPLSLEKISRVCNAMHFSIYALDDKKLQSILIMIVFS